MVLLILLLVLTALVSYYIGCLNLLVIASHLIYRKNLMAYEFSNSGITRFFKDTSLKQLALFVLLALFKFGFPVLLGGWLMSGYGITVVGRTFAMLCMLMGCRFPLIGGYRPQSSLAVFTVSAFFVNFELGFGMAVILAIVYFVSHYISLTAVSAALSAFVLSVVVVENSIVTRMMLVCAIIVIIEHRKSIPRIIKGTEPKFRYRKDLSYMLDGQ
ncbi:MAG: glycerol-3-phosphate acyltransferase [Oscillospiraceae bacterium]|nr:glycerol-3-phosphate acyltransferase [Oscillospiraceae bacterium]